MLKTGVIIDPRYLRHVNPGGHPERIERIQVLLDMQASYKREGLVRLDPREATQDEIALNHTRDYIEQVAATAELEQSAFDMDTFTSRESYGTALLAAGGFLALLEAIMSGDVDNGFASVRPPGHHAEANRAMGFCLFNNVAVGARHLIDVFGLERILILDWDLHHGNGTQNSFYDDKQVLYVSTHQSPHYPGSGSVSEIGVGEGLGYTVNIPFSAGTGDEAYVAAFREIVVPITRQYRPQFILVSAGFDAHIMDPLGAMELSTEGYRKMTRLLMQVARDHTEGRMACILEGGYNLDALRDSVKVVLDELGGERIAEKIPEVQSRTILLDPVKQALSDCWKL